MPVLFTSESVSEGHPDKICDAVSDAILDLHLHNDAAARCAVEALATTGRIVIAGETKSAALPSAEEIEETVRRTIRRIGYEQQDFDWRTIVVENYLHTQSADISRGVDRKGAGDQGIMFGYAKNEKGFECCYMPLAIKLAHQILENISIARRQNKIPGIGPDAKSQVTVRYQDGQASGIAKIVVSTQHNPRLTLPEVREIIKKYIKESLPAGWMPPDKDILINPTGRFVIGGPAGDTGLTGRKIIVDTYGGYAPHGGGAFSGKDPTKVDRSAAYMMRYLAKNVVAAGLAEECLLQVSYAIGVADPLSFYINTRGSAVVDEQKILRLLREMADLTPCGIIKHLKLNRPIYEPTSAYGHFGRIPLPSGTFSWEQLNLAEELKNAF